MKFIFMSNKVKTRQEIADEYGVSTKTLSRWLKKKNLDISSGFVTPKEQNQIYEVFGEPPKK